jgi:predicted transglutaminase-like cysteine proteinase
MSRSTRGVEILLLAMLMTGCASSVDIPDFPEGERAFAPLGYTDHCRREPESVFCP